MGNRDDRLLSNQEAPLSPLTWSSKKIPRVVRSTLSAEAYAMSKAVDLLGWIRALWGVIHIPGFQWQQPELGFKQLPKYSTDDFFNVISKRYETKSTIITTNKIIEQWNDIFDEQVLTRAIVDRIMHHASIVSINGKSFRMKTKNKTKKEVT